MGKNSIQSNLTKDDLIAEIRLTLGADFILSLMELIVGGKDGLQPVERTVIDRCVRQMYREHLQDPETSKMPTLQTLYDLLCSQPEGEAVRLATALEIYVSGSLNVFNHETNVDLNRRLVCLDLKKLGAGLRTIAMLIMQDLVNSQEMCIRDRHHPVAHINPHMGYRAGAVIGSREKDNVAGLCLGGRNDSTLVVNALRRGTGQVVDAAGRVHPADKARIVKGLSLIHILVAASFPVTGFKVV